jgi:hypothetical protein
MASSDAQKVAAIPIIHAPGLPFLNVMMASVPTRVFSPRIDANATLALNFAQ